MKYREYMGMSYEAASREAQRLIERDGWFQSFDRLAELRVIMYRHVAPTIIKQMVDEAHELGLE